MADNVYEILEAAIPSYRKYIDIPVCDNGEPMVELPLDGQIRGRQFDFGSRELTDGVVEVRADVRNRLWIAAEFLVSLDAGFSLEVGYGYRPLEVQRRKYDEQLVRLSNEYDDEQKLCDAAHRFVAIPQAAGHPTGGAVDISIYREDVELDFGTSRWELEKDSYTFSPYISESALRNRMLLRETMVRAGFAPYGGEWWHFSYGDKEWAYVTKSPTARYDQL